MAIAPFPHHYTVGLENESLIAPHRAPILGWSPEDLLVGAALLSAKTTFDAYAASAGVPIYSWAGSATGILDRSTSGLVFTSIALDVDVETAPGLEGQVADLLRKVERTCIVSRSLTARVEILPTIRSHARAS